jgi:hypothetical protein
VVTKLPRPAVALQAYGVSLCVRGGDAGLVGALRARALAHGWVDTSSTRVDLDYSLQDDRGASLRCNGETIQAAAEPDALVDAFENHSKIELALRAPDRVFVHAGVVGWHGRAIVIPGRSRSGKTTLVEALVRAGAEYYSDEFAILDARGYVHPYAIPLAVRSPGGRTAVAVETIGGRAGTVPLPVSLIVLTEYQARSRWRPRAVSPALGMLGLMENTVAARQAPERTMPTLRAAVAVAAVLRGRRGGAEAVTRSLLGRLA